MKALFSSHLRRVCGLMLFWWFFTGNNTILGESIQYSTTINWEKEFVDTFIAPDGNEYCTISLPNSSNNVTPGLPNIPYLEYGFLVPDGAGEFRVKINSFEIQDSIVLTAPLIPSQPCWSLNDIGNKPFWGLASEIYNDWSKEPEGLISDDFYFNAQYHIVKTLIPSVSYNPKSLTLFLYSKINLELEYTLDSAPYLSIHNNVGSEIPTEINELIVNPPKNRNKVNSTSNLVPLTPQWYYIVTPNSLKPSVNKIADLKRQKGYNVKIVSIEDIISLPEFKVNGTTIVDEANSVRNWLISERKKIDSFYVLFIGNSKTLTPIRKLRSGKQYDIDPVLNWTTGQYIPTDGYFSDMTSNYPLTKEANGHYSALVTNLSYSPDLMVGRLLANNEKEITRYVQKLLTYEFLPFYSTNRYNYLNKGMITRQYQHRKYASLFNNVTGFKDSVVLTDQYGYTEFSKSQPTGENIIMNMKECGLISLMGHGSPSTFACAGGNTYPSTGEDASQDMRYIKPLADYGPDLRWLKQEENNNSLDLLHNEGKPSVIYTLSCDIIPFDSLFYLSNTGKNLPYNLGEGFTVAGDYGGVAFIGNTRTGYDYYTQKLELEFGKQINKRISIGEAMKQSAFATTYKYSQYTRNIIGDPEIKIWMGCPSALNLNILCTNRKVEVTGDNLTNSKIVIFDGNTPKSFRVGALNNLSFTESEYGTDFVISIFKDDFVPLWKLYANNSNLTTKKRYILSETFLNGENGYGFNINQNGFLSIYCLENFETNKGFEINKGGSLELECTGCTKLSNDILNDGSALIIKSNNTVLQNGFTVNKGAKFEISL